MKYEIQFLCTNSDGGLGAVTKTPEMIEMKRIGDFNDENWRFCYKQGRKEISFPLRYLLSVKPIAEQEQEAVADVAKPVNADDNNGWIRVKDKLPEQEKRVLVRFMNNSTGIPHTSIDYLRDGKFYELGEKAPWCEVTHWQYIPDPPKDERR